MVRVFIILQHASQKAVRRIAPGLKFHIRSSRTSKTTREHHVIAALEDEQVGGRMSRVPERTQAFGRRGISGPRDPNRLRAFQDFRPWCRSCGRWESLRHRMSHRCPGWWVCSWRLPLSPADRIVFSGTKNRKVSTSDRHGRKSAKRVTSDTEAREIQFAVQGKRRIGVQCSQTVDDKADVQRTVNGIGGYGHGVAQGFQRPQTVQKILIAALVLRTCTEIYPRLAQCWPR